MHSTVRHGLGSLMPIAAFTIGNWSTVLCGIKKLSRELPSHTPDLAETTKLPHIAGHMCRGFVVHEIVHISTLQIFNPVSSIMPRDVVFISFAEDIKYTPCPAWVLCDRRSTCPFKHCDALPSQSQEVALPALPIFYPSLPQPPAPVAYTQPGITTLNPNPVEVNGTTYFPLPHEASLTDPNHDYLQNAPIAVPITIPPLSYSLPGTMIPTSLSPPPVHCTHQFCVESPSPEQACANELSPPSPSPGAHAQNMHSVLTEDAKSHHHVEPIFASSGIKSELKPPDTPLHQIAQCKVEIEPTSSQDPVEADAGEHHQEHHPRKRKLQCHARRISINVKTGEVVERTPEGRYGVYEL